jgi:uncharacterized membrane protein YfcA
LELSGLSTEFFTFLFFISVLAGFLDTLAGGGGLITLPALILSGVPPLAALGTNKLQGSMGTATATYLMLKNKKIHWRDIKPLMLSAFVGAVFGATIVQFINTDILSFVIPAVLVSITVYFLVSPKPGHKDGSPSLSERKYKYGVIPVIGGYDGMFGPGTGSFFAVAGMSCRGHNLLLSTATAKPLNFSTNIASLIIFVAAGQVVWLVGGLMMVGQAIGARIGSHYLFKINPAHLRKLVVIMCSGMLVKYCDAMGWIDIITNIDTF